MNHTMQALEAAKAALDAVNDYDIKNMLPLELWWQVINARALVVGAIAVEQLGEQE